MPTPKHSKIEPAKQAAPPKLKPGMFMATMQVLGKPVKAVCDPIARVCYPALEEHWEERYRKPWPTKYARRMLILDFTLVTIAATLFVGALVWYFLIPAVPGFGPVGLQTIAPREVVSGAMTEFMVVYRNDSQRELGCASLRIHLPPDTVLEEQVPARDPQEKICALTDQAGHPMLEEGPAGATVVYDLGNVGPNVRDVIRLKARTYGPTGSTKILSSELLYWKEAGTAPERVSSRMEWKIERGVLHMTAETPERLVRGRQTSVTYTIENVSADEVGPLTLRLTRPDDFVMTGTTPVQDGRIKESWDVPALAPGDKLEFAVLGYFVASGNAHPAPVLTLDAYVREGERELLLEEIRPNLDAKASGFLISHQVSAATRGAFVPGERVTVTVRYDNQGTETLRDAKVALHADERFVEDASPAGLAWDATNTPALAEITPGQGGTLTAQFTVRRDAPAVGEDGAPVLGLYAYGSFALADEPENIVRVSSAPTELPVATRIAAEAAAFYFTRDGDQLGLGPLPPRVGQTTKYRVVLNITNTSGDARDVLLEAKLPPNVTWTGRYSVSSGQAIDWLPMSGTVHWEIGLLPAIAGGEDEGVGASFEVALTPSEAQAGTVATLLRDIELSGVDVATGVRLHAVAAPVTTDLPFDPRAAGKGTVQE